MTVVRIVYGPECEATPSHHVLNVALNGKRPCIWLCSQLRFSTAPCPRYPPNQGAFSNSPRVAFSLYSRWKKRESPHLPGHVDKTDTAMSLRSNNSPCLGRGHSWWLSRVSPWASCKDSLPLTLALWLEGGRQQAKALMTCNFFFFYLTAWWGGVRGGLGLLSAALVTDTHGLPPGPADWICQGALNNDGEGSTLAGYVIFSQALIQHTFNQWE